MFREVKVLVKESKQIKHTHTHTPLVKASVSQTFGKRQKNVILLDIVKILSPSSHLPAIVNVPFFFLNTEIVPSTLNMVCDKFRRMRGNLGYRCDKWTVKPRRPTAAQCSGAHAAPVEAGTLLTTPTSCTELSNLVTDCHVLQPSQRWEVLASL